MQAHEISQELAAIMERTEARISAAHQESEAQYKALCDTLKLDSRTWIEQMHDAVRIMAYKGKKKIAFAALTVPGVRHAFVLEREVDLKILNGCYKATLAPMLFCCVADAHMNNELYVAEIARDLKAIFNEPPMERDIMIRLIPTEQYLCTSKHL